MDSIRFNDLRSFSASSVLALAAMTTPVVGQPLLWQQKQVSGPSARYGHAMVYDSTRGVVVLFGGATTGSSGLLGDTWEWNGTSWSLRSTTGPSPRTSPAMAFDSERGRTVLFSGQNGPGYDFATDTWEWDGNAWTLRATQGPLGRDGHAMTFDPIRNVCVMFGGANGPGTTSSLADTWEWDGTVWTQRTDAGPNASFGHKLVFHEGLGRSVLVRRSDTWTWDGTAWQQSASGAPLPSRGGAACAFDVDRGVVNLFGGFATTNVGDTWEWNGAGWSQRLIAGPTPRFQPAMAYDAARKQYVLFGGYTSNVTAETWTLTSPLTVWADTFQASRGTPASQGMIASPYGGSQQMVGGLLRLTGTNSSDGFVFTKIIPSNFSQQQGRSFELRASVVQAGYQNLGSNWRTGCIVSMSDSAGRLAFLGLADTGLRISTGVNLESSLSSPFIPLPNMNQERSYRVSMYQGRAYVYVDGTEVTSIPITGPVGTIPNFVQFGIEGYGGAKDVSVRSFRVGGFGVDFASAGALDDALFNSSRSETFPGSSTLNYNSLTVQSGGFFGLGPNETLNLGNGQGTLYINQGGVFFGNGIIVGNVFNSGLLIIPITRPGTLSSTSGGVVRVSAPVPTSFTPQPITPPSPPQIQPQTTAIIGRSGFGNADAGVGSGNTGGGGGGGTPQAGWYTINSPSVTVQGTATWDGRLDVTGTYTQASTGALRLFIAGETQGQTYSYLNVGQSAALEGTLQIVVQPELLDYLPAVGTTFDMIRAAGGITIPNGLQIRPLMTAAGAARLGISLPSFSSGYAADPNQLVMLPDGVFSYQLVDSGRSLQIRVEQPICGVPQVIEDQQACSGATVEFQTVFIGASPVTYSWRKGGQPIDPVQNPTASTPSLILNNVSPLDSDVYDCVITSPCQTSTTNSASLDVSLCKCVDFNRNGVFPEDQDVTDFLDVLAGAPCPTAECNDVDFNGNGVFPEDQDVIDFFNVLAGGDC